MACLVVVCGVVSISTDIQYPSPLLLEPHEVARLRVSHLALVVLTVGLENEYGIVGINMEYQVLDCQAASCHVMSNWAYHLDI